MSRLIGKAQDFFTKKMYGKENPTRIAAFYELMDRDMDGKEVPMSSFQGSVLCVVNVASKWGLTRMNYTNLSKLVDTYGNRGFQVLAFPCNQFNRQEPGTHSEILDFVEQKFNAKDKITFFEKGDVNGANTREVFSFLKQHLPNEDGSTDIRWNFGKFLVDHEGNPYKRYGSSTNPMEMEDAIQELLVKKEQE